MCNTTQLTSDQLMITGESGGIANLRRAQYKVNGLLVVCVSDQLIWPIHTVACMYDIGAPVYITVQKSSCKVTTPLASMW